MLESIAHIGAALAAARKKKGLSQRALSQKTRIPQSHISKIENGAIDLQVSSLIEISRVLELELMLVPRNVMPGLQALMRPSKGNSQRQVPMYRLETHEEEEDV